MCTGNIFCRKVGNYRLPSLDLLSSDCFEELHFVDYNERKDKMRFVSSLFSTYGIIIKSIDVYESASFSVYDVHVADGTDSRKVEAMIEDFSFSENGTRVTVLENEKNILSVELSNMVSHKIYLRSLLLSTDYMETDKRLPIICGSDLKNRPLVSDLTDLQHLFVGGSSGSGKSLFLHNLIVSLLYSKSPDNLKLVLIENIRKEFGVYEMLGKCFLAEMSYRRCAVPTGYEDSFDALSAVCMEMEYRKNLMKSVGVKDFKEYNVLSGKTGRLPDILMVIDEFSDFLDPEGAFEERLCSLLHYAHEVGIYLVVTTGKTARNTAVKRVLDNFRAKAVFRVSAADASKSILGHCGAEQLKRYGDLLFYNGNCLVRLQSAYIDISDIWKLSWEIRKNCELYGYDSRYILPKI